MTLVDRDSKFREQLAAAYQIGDLGAADFAVSMTITAPDRFLTSLERCQALLFGLELLAAFFGHPHPAIQHIKVDRFQWPRQRMSSNCEQAVTALFLLSQSQYGPDFVDDNHQLRPRLFAIAQKYSVSE